jgi:hypothetical protein
MVPYCTKPSKVKSRHRLEDYACLIRLYLGKWSLVQREHLEDRLLGQGNFFRPSNFKMYFDHMIDLKLHVHFIAAMMADALETMHGGVSSNDERFLPSCEK